MKPQRKCIGCGAIKNQDELIRLGFDGENIRIDNEKRLASRGCYLCNTDSCLTKAIKKRAFNRTFKTEISSEHIGRCFNDK